MEVSEAEGLTQPEVAKIFTNLLSGAEKKVDMSCGLYVPFYSNHDVSSAIMDSARKTKSFRILIDNRVNAEEQLRQLEYLSLLAREGVVSLARAGNYIPHWLIVDNKNMRLEKPHPISEPSGDNMMIRNATPEIADKVAREYENMWLLATRITVK